MMRKLIPQNIMNLPFHHMHFLKGHFFTVETIEDRLNEMNLDRVRKKEKTFHLKNMTKI